MMKSPFIKSLGRLLLAIILIVIGVLAFVSTPVGKAVLVKQIEILVSNPEQQVQIGKLTGSVFSNFQIDQISVADHGGTWLEIKNLKVKWAPIHLILAGETRLYDIKVSQIIAHRPPVHTQNTTSNSSFALPVDVLIGALTVDEIELIRDGFGFAAKFSLNGRTVIQPPYFPVALQLSAKRNDAISGSLELSSTFDPIAEHLVVSIDLSEESGGAVASILNLKERPALDFSLYGEGNFKDWFGNFEINANEQKVSQGYLETGYENGIITLNTSIAGNITKFSPTQFEKLISGDFNSEITSRFELGDSIELTSFNYASEYFKSTGSGNFTASGLPVYLSAAFSLDLPSGEQFELPTLPNISLSDSTLMLDYQVSENDPTWSITGEVHNFELYGNTFDYVDIVATGSVSLDAEGEYNQFPFDISLDIDSPVLAYLELHELIGDAGTLSAKGSAQSLTDFTIEMGTITGDIGTINYSLQFEDKSLFITAHTDLTDLNELSEYVGQNLGGSGDLALNTKLDFKQQSYYVEINAETNDLFAGIPQLEQFFVGPSKFSGQLNGSFDSSLVTVSDFMVSTNPIEFFADGEFSAENFLFRLSSELNDASLLNPEFVGQIGLDGVISGEFRVSNIETSETSVFRTILTDLKLSSDRLLVAGNTFDEVFLKVDADLIDFVGTINASSRFSGELISLSTNFQRHDNGNFQFSEANIFGGGITIVGDTILSENRWFNGLFKLEIADLKSLSNFLPLEISGQVTSEIMLSSTNERQNIQFESTAEELLFLNNEVPELVLGLTISDIWSAFHFNADLTVPGATLGGIELDQFKGKAQGIANKLNFEIDAQKGAYSVQTIGVLTSFTQGYAVVLNIADLNFESFVVPLTEPARMIFQNGEFVIQDARWVVDDGVIALSGQSNNKISVQINDIALDIINNFVPNLDLVGQVSGSIDSYLNLESFLVDWNLELSGISNPVFQENSFDALNADITGNYSEGIGSFEISVVNDQNVDILATGTTGLSFDNLNAVISGYFPLKLVDGIPDFAARSINFDGEVNISFEVNSSISPPAFNGVLTVENASYRNPLVGIEITEFSLSAKTEENLLVLEHASGKINDDGEINASGTVELDPAKFFPADLNMEIKQGRFIQEQLISVTFDAKNLTILGPLLTSPDLTGEIDISSLEITIPDRLPGEYSEFDVRHISASPDIIQQAMLFRGEIEQTELDGPPFVGNIDVSILVSEGGFFIRGRGIFAEMEGDLQLSGTTDNPVASGVFTMEKGRLSLLGKNLIFERGIVTFAGDLVPELDFVSTHETLEATIYVRVNGRATNPEFIFESVPDLPQDEILALLIFGRQFDQLSTLQVATLAAQVAAYTSNLPVGWGFVGESIGVDILDLTTDEEGNTNFEIGKYINERLYFGLTKKGETSSVAVDLDITSNLKGRGELDELGESKVGVEFNYDF